MRVTPTDSMVRVVRALGQWRRWRRFAADEEGSVTIEAAFALAALVAVAAAVVGAIATMAAYVAAVDTAGAAARAHAIGAEFIPPREDMTVDVRESADLIHVEVAVPAPVGTMRAHAAFPAEVGARD